jgi:hypothetical protein
MPVFLHSVILGIRRFCRLHVGLGNQFVASRGQEKTWAPRHRQRSAQPGQAGGFGKEKGVRALSVEPFL